MSSSFGCIPGTSPDLHQLLAWKRTPKNSRNQYRGQYGDCCGAGRIAIQCNAVPLLAQYSEDCGSGRRFFLDPCANSITPWNSSKLMLISGWGCSKLLGSSGG